MNSPQTLAFAFVAAAAVGVAGYLYGSRDAHGTSDRAAIETMLAEATGDRPPEAATPVPGAIQMAEMSESERQEVEAIIRDYLLANPEVVRDAIYALQLKEEQEAKEAQISTIVGQAERLFSSPIDVVLGNPDGDVTLVEFFDYNCGYCRRAQADMQRLLDSDPNLRVVLKEFPILGPGSFEAAQVAMALLLTDRDNYHAFHDALLVEPGQVDGDRALALAEEMGFDVAVLEAKSNSEEVRAAITESHELAQLLQLTGTPSYVTERAVVVGAVGYAALKAEIERVRACNADSAAC